MYETVITVVFATGIAVIFVLAGILLDHFLLAPRVDTAEAAFHAEFSQLHKKFDDVIDAVKR